MIEFTKELSWQLAQALRVGSRLEFKVVDNNFMLRAKALGYYSKVADGIQVLNLDNNKAVVCITDKISLSDATTLFSSHSTAYVGQPANKVYNTIKSLDLTKMDTSQLINMNEMFYDCRELEYLDISNFNTVQVTNMAGLFYNCRELEYIDISNFNTAQVTNMAGMFSGCESLERIDISNFNTEQVRDMQCMFTNCTSLKKLNMRNFNTTQVKDMYSMFKDCTGLEELDLSSFNTKQVEDMYGMFHRCINLKKLDIRNFNMTKVKTASMMFCDCDALDEIIINKEIKEYIIDIINKDIISKVKRKKRIEIGDADGLVVLRIIKQ